MTTINDRSDIMHEEIHSWGVLQSEKMDRLFAAAQERGVYKGVVSDSSAQVILTFICAGTGGPLGRHQSQGVYQNTEKPFYS